MSNGGKRYFILFSITLVEKHRFIICMKNLKLSAFQSFKALVEKEAGTPIKVLRSDHGGEYNSEEFISFCDEQRIKKQLTATYSP